MKTLNVKKVSKHELRSHWNNMELPFKWPPFVYIRCNAKGEVNWEKNPVYQPDELIERGNYNVIT